MNGLPSRTAFTCSKPKNVVETMKTLAVTVGGKMPPLRQNRTAVSRGILTKTHQDG